MDRPTTMRAFLPTYALSMGLALASAFRAMRMAPESMSQTAMLITSVVLAAIIILLGYKIYQGRNWARIIFSAMVVYGLLIMITGNRPAVPIYPNVLMDWAQAVLQAACVVLLYMRPTRDWFNDQRTSGA